MIDNYHSFSLLNPARSSRKKCGRRRRLSCNRREQRISFVAGRDRAGRAGRRAGEEVVQGSQSKSAKERRSRPCKKKKRRKKNVSSFVASTAPRDADPILFALPKKNGRGQTGGVGCEVSGEERVPLRRDRRHKPSERPSV